MLQNRLLLMKKFLSIITLIGFTFVGCRGGEKNTPANPQIPSDLTICQICSGVGTISRIEAVTVMEWNGYGYSPTVRYETKYSPCACILSTKPQSK